MGMKTQKLCILPGQEPIRLATTRGGHSILIGEEPVAVPDIFVREARGRGAISELELNNLKKRLKGEPVAKGEPPSPSDPGESLSSLDDSAMEAVMAAVVQIVNRGDTAEIDALGRPSVEAVAAITGFEVSGEERDLAFERVTRVPGQ